jgi:hypothetical protein
MLRVEFNVVQFLLRKHHQRGGRRYRRVDIQPNLVICRQEFRNELLSKSTPNQVVEYDRRSELEVLKYVRDSVSNLMSEYQESTFDGPENPDDF